MNIMLIFPRTTKYKMKIHTGSYIGERIGRYLVKHYGEKWHEKSRYEFMKGLIESVEKGINKINHYMKDILEQEQLTQISKLQHHSHLEQINSPASDLNDIADQLLRKADQLVKKRGLDPYELPNVEHDFTWMWKPARIYLTRGHFDGTSTMKRNGDAKAIYHPNRKHLHMSQSVVLGEAVVKYDYLVKMFPGLRNNGSVIDDIHALSIQLNIGFSFESFQFSLEGFSISDSGFNIGVHTGDLIFQALANWLGKKYGGDWHKNGRNMFEEGMKKSIKKGMNNINEFIDDILG